jgi:hypothetical protein
MEITPDGFELNDQEIDTGIQLGDEIFGELLDEYDDPARDPFYSLWINLTYLLASQGWTADELARDARYHATMFDTVGSA